MKTKILFVLALIATGVLGIPETVLIPGGSFEMGDHIGFVDPKHGGDEIPIHTVRVDAFEIGVYHITSAQYCEFLNAACEQIEARDGGVYLAGRSELLIETRALSPYSRIGWDGKAFTVLDKKEDHPVICIRWEGAAVYCNWLSAQQRLPSCYNLANWDCDFNKSGYRLPTEAEWEYAARGGLHEPYRNFPWGDEADATKANWPESDNPFQDGPEPKTTPVGYYPPNGYGLYDMAGNAWQLINDWYQSDYYAYSPVDNPPGPAAGKLMPDGKPYRGMRGGNWYNGLNGHSRVSNRNPSYWRGPQDPDHPYYHIGFRIARPIDAESRPMIEPTPVQQIKGDRRGKGPRMGGKPEKGKRPEGKPDKPWLLEHADELDVNGDGAVSKAEMLDEAEKAFGLYDVDHNNVLEASELRGGMVKSAMGGFIQLHSKELDENSNGAISREEILNVSGMLFDKSDKNRDGKLADDEPKGRGGKGKGGQK